MLSTRKLISLSILAHFVGTASPAMAGQVTYTVTSAPTPLTAGFLGPWGIAPWGASLGVLVPKFDPNLGQLNQITLTGTTNVTGVLNAENVNPVGVGSDWYFSLRNDSSGESYDVAWVLPAFDGIVDFAGTSGGTLPFGGQLCVNGLVQSGPCGPGPSSSTSATLLDTYSGAGTIAKSVPFGIGWGPFFGVGVPFQPPVVNVTASATLSFTVTYDYDSYPSRFCTASAVSCPCSGTATAGCANSVDPLGGDLVPMGSSSVAADTFALTASRLPSTTVGLFFQGTTSTFTGNVLGDGRLCVNGNVTRLAIRAAVAGQIQYPVMGDPPISATGFVPAGGAYRAYQLWYRDSAAFCTSATNNLTSAVSVLWTP